MKVWKFKKSIEIDKTIGNIHIETFNYGSFENNKPKHWTELHCWYECDCEHCPSSWVEDLIDNSRCEEKQEKTRDEKTIDAIDFAIKATDSQDDYGMGMRNGMRYVKSLIDGEQPQYEIRRTDEEIKLGINLGDEVVGDYGAKGVVVGIDTYKGDVMLSLLMSNHKVPQLVKASSYKTKTGRHFPQIAEVLEQMKVEADGK